MKAGQRLQRSLVQAPVDSPRSAVLVRQGVGLWCLFHLRLSVMAVAVLMGSGVISGWSTEQPITGYLTKEAHGVLALGVFTGMDGRDDLPPQGPVRAVTVYTTPNTNAGVLMTLAQVSDMEALETDYEMKTAVVYDQRPEWFQIKTRAGLGWVAKVECGKFTPVEELLRDRMSYLIVDPHAKCALYQQPSLTAAQIPAKVPADDVRDGQVPARLLEWKWSQGQAWIKVRVHARSYGDLARDENVGTTGWLPAYQRNQLIMWFYARGM